MDAHCPLCQQVGGRLVYRGQKFRVIHADELGFPAFYRVVWQAHVAEFSDLNGPERQLCLGAVVAVEQALRQQLRPTKINLATLGNRVSHLHWHVIARFAWDSHFPAPVWATAQRATDEAELGALSAQLPAAEQSMVTALSTLA